MSAMSMQFLGLCSTVHSWTRSLQDTICGHQKLHRPSERTHTALYVCNNWTCVPLMCSFTMLALSCKDDCMHRLRAYVSFSGCLNQWVHPKVAYGGVVHYSRVPENLEIVLWWSLQKLLHVTCPLIRLLASSTWLFSRFHFHSQHAGHLAAA